MNIILDPIFIHGWFGIPAMGIAGAAVATVIGQIVTALLAVWYIVHMKIVKPGKADYRLGADIVKRTLAREFFFYLKYL